MVIFLCKGNSLKEFKLHFAGDIDVAHKTVSLGLFDFRSFLNVGMLLTTSEKAKYVRTRILDIVIATINEKTGGGTKYIHRRVNDEDYSESIKLELMEAMSQGIGFEEDEAYDGIGTSE